VGEVEAVVDCLNVFWCRLFFLNMCSRYFSQRMVAWYGISIPEPILYVRLGLLAICSLLGCFKVDLVSSPMRAIVVWSSAY
jgi:hypothetical protein